MRNLNYSIDMTSKMIDGKIQITATATDDSNKIIKIIKFNPDERTYAEVIDQLYSEIDKHKQSSINLNNEIFIQFDKNNTRINDEMER